MFVTTDDSTCPSSDGGRGWNEAFKIVSDQIDDINKVPRERSTINCLSLACSLNANKALAHPNCYICCRCERYETLEYVVRVRARIDGNDQVDTTY